MKISISDFGILLIIFILFPVESIFCEGTDYLNNKPLSNLIIAEKIFGLAMDNASFPDGLGREIKIEISGIKENREIIMQNAIEILNKKNYIVSEKNQSIPLIKIKIEKTDISLSALKSSKKLIERKSEIKISIDIDDIKGDKKVYTGNAQFTDTFDKKYLKVINVPNDDFNLTNFAENKVKSKVKPVAISVSMTILVWFLYSYRG